MKLLFCLDCQDIVRLHMEKRTCLCGKSWGQYLEDKSTTIQTRNSISVGLANPDFSSALSTLMADANRCSPNLFIRTWLNTDSEADVQYVKASEASETTED